MNVDELIEKMWEVLDLVRVYTKPRGLPPDYNAPVVLRRGKCSVEDFCNAIHKEIAKQMKYAIVWGASAKHARGQKVGLEHVLEDEDGMFFPFAFSHSAHHKLCSSQSFTLRRSRKRAITRGHLERVHVLRVVYRCMV